MTFVMLISVQPENMVGDLWYFQYQMCISYRFKHVVLIKYQYFGVLTYVVYVPSVRPKYD